MNTSPTWHSWEKKRSIRRARWTSTRSSSESSSARGSVRVDSIDTGEIGRDEHLRSPDFLDAGEFPEITFESTRIEAIDGESSRLYGNLTMHGVTREIGLDVLIRGTDIDPRGNLRAGPEVMGTLTRSDFDMKVNQVLGSGNVMVADEVKIALDIPAILQQP